MAADVAMDVVGAFRTADPAVHGCIADECTLPSSISKVGGQPDVERVIGVEGRRGANAPRALMSDRRMASFRLIVN